ncbi:MAG: hypothetical protein IKQ18_09125, partial [Clostridia bacterium]|nr:hypothetical protein [Clostridia bacterium]
MKKLIVVFLAALMLLACFAGCANNNTNPSNNTNTDKPTTTVEEETDPEVTTDNSYVPDLPEEKFGGEFSILCEGAFWGTEDNLYYEEASDDP